MIASAAAGATLSVQGRPSRWHKLSMLVRKLSSHGVTQLLTVSCTPVRALRCARKRASSASSSSLLIVSCSAQCDARRRQRASL